MAVCTKAAKTHPTPNRRARVVVAVMTAALLVSGCGNGLFGRGDASEIETASVRQSPVVRGVAAWDGDISTPGLTAGHRNMTPGAWARVTNVKSGQSAAVRITHTLDGRRGHDIELSRDAASAVGVLHEGMTEVLIEPIDPRAATPTERLWTADATPSVEVTTPAPYQNALAAPTGAPRSAPGQIAYGTDVAYTPDIATNSIPNATSVAPTGTSVAGARYLQLGAFRQEGNARTLLGRLQREGLASGLYGDGFIETAFVGGQAFHRVRVGPLTNEIEAQRALRDARAKGHNDARILRP